MTAPLKILMLEDNTTDAEIVQRMLLKGNLFFEFRLAIDKETYLEALDKFQPDIILSDHSFTTIQFNKCPGCGP
jgi:PleD family two-component response regulator